MGRVEPLTHLQNTVQNQEHDEAGTFSAQLLFRPCTLQISTGHREPILGKNRHVARSGRPLLPDSMNSRRKEVRNAFQNAKQLQSDTFLLQLSNYRFNTTHELTAAESAWPYNSALSNCGRIAPGYETSKLKTPSCRFA